MVLVTGCDEAGRGPIIGPMVMCGVIIEDTDIPKLEEIGVKDSKKLTPKKRKILFALLFKRRVICKNRKK